jgi:photosystem II S4 domain protein
MLPKADLLRRVEAKERISHVIDQAEQALKTWEVVLTDFLSPPELAEVQDVFGLLAEVQTMSWGGYPQAERQRLALARSELSLARTQVEVVALSIAGNFLFDPATHRDFLGAILGAGIVREKVGDILVLGERGAQALVVPEMAIFLSDSLTQVRTVSVKTEAISLDELRVREPRRKEMTTVEASLRLDAIASAGFGLSRSKMVNFISAGDVCVNWKTITQTSHALQAGDLVTVRGKGRIEIGDVKITKKQRYRIELKRYS